MELVDPAAGIALRPWRADDGPALAAAWADPDVARWASVPSDPSLDAARAWIAGAEVRAAAGAALDLVVGPVGGDEVWGEVGLARLRLRAAGVGERAVGDVGWWVAAAHRGRGVATAAVRLLVATADPSWHPLVARIAPGHVASEAVAARAGLVRRGRLDAAHDLWVLPATVDRSG